MTPLEQRLADALLKARVYVESASLAEHMLDGFGTRTPQPSDEVLAEVDEALATLDQPTDKWVNAPKWAKWLAMDKSGNWYGFEYKPICSDYVWLRDEEKAGLMFKVVVKNDYWRESLEMRK